MDCRQDPCLVGKCRNSQETIDVSVKRKGEGGTRLFVVVVFVGQFRSSALSQLPDIREY